MLLAQTMVQSETRSLLDLNTYLNDVVTVLEYGRVFVRGLSDVNGDRC